MRKISIVVLLFSNLFSFSSFLTIDDKAYSSNIINTVIFKHHGLITKDKYQFGGYYNKESKLTIFKRDLSSNKIEKYTLSGVYNTKDAHNALSIGIDKKGYIHISYDHHVDNLNYRKSLKPYDITSWSEEIPMTGKREDKVTYPTYIKSQNDKYPLMFMYRNGKSGNGDICIKTYNVSNDKWRDIEPCFLSGTRSKPWTSNAYFNNPIVTNDGKIYLSYTWRTHSIGKEKRVNNINIDFAKSLDYGKTWQTSNDMPYRLPITQINSETIYAVSPGKNLINQTSMAIDSNEYPHIVYYANDEDNHLEYQHLWYNGKKWNNQVVSKRDKVFDLLGGGYFEHTS